MAKILTSYGREGFGDRQPPIDTVLRDIADDLATVMGASVGALTSSAPAAVTSSQNATAAAVDLTTTQALANALKANYNQAQADIAALRATLAAVQADVAATRTAVNADVGTLKTTKG